MIKQNVKFTHNSFEYYELNISVKTEMELIKSKLVDFKSAMQSINDVIVLSFTEDCDAKYIENIVLVTKEITQKLGIVLHSIKRNVGDIVNKVGTDCLLDIPIINLPVSKKSKHIYNKSLVINEPVRSGARIHNDGDIIITNFVSNGAEIIATGNIHVYGELRGRAIAGSYGDKLAKIFALKFNPELISVGGVYRAIDSALPDNLLNKFVVVSLDNKDRLNIATVG
ncbi:MAG: septum site-determining protein MinC [Neisseriaceae bacterium]